MSALLRVNAYLPFCPLKITISALEIVSPYLNVIVLNSASRSLPNAIRAVSKAFPLHLKCVRIDAWASNVIKRSEII